MLYLNNNRPTMYPYNRALNRSLRKSKADKQTEEDKMSDISVESETDIVWDPAEFKLSHVLDNFPLPQIVRVVEGFMLSEDDSLASGTVLTIHGQQTIEQICGNETQGFYRDINIPLNCPFKVKLTVPNKDRVYRTIKDLCNASPLPKCVIVQKKISASGVNVPAGRCLIVNEITRNHMDEAFGLLVSAADNEMNSFVLQLKVEGNFRPSPFPRDQYRLYFVRELVDRPFPIWVEFAQSADKNAFYGPHLGVLKLSKFVTSHVVFATSVIEGQKYAISFSRDLPVTIEIARGMLDNTATYVRRCKAAKEQVDIDVLSHLTEANPYAEEFRSSIYEDVKALREAFKMKEMMKNSSYSSDSRSVSSDVSFGDDFRSYIDTQFIMALHSPDLPSLNTGSSSRTSQGRETVSCSSPDNMSVSSIDSRENPVVTESVGDPETRPHRGDPHSNRIGEISNDKAISCQKEACSDDEYEVANPDTFLDPGPDYDSDDGYEKIPDWIDRPSSHRSKQTRNNVKGNEYSYVDWTLGDAKRAAPKVPPKVPLKPPKISHATSSRSLPARIDDSLRKSPYSSRQSLNPSSPKHFEKSIEHDPPYDDYDGHIPETLGSDLPHGGFFSLLDDSDEQSAKSDEASVCSDYQSVKSEQGSVFSLDKFAEETRNVYEGFHTKNSSGSGTSGTVISGSETSGSKISGSRISGQGVSGSGTSGSGISGSGHGTTKVTSSVAVTSTDTEEKPALPKKAKRTPPVPLPRRGRSASNYDESSDLSKRKLETAKSCPATSLLAGDLMGSIQAPIYGIVPKPGRDTSAENNQGEFNNNVDNNANIKDITNSLKTPETLSEIPVTAIPEESDKDEVVKCLNEDKELSTSETDTGDYENFSAESENNCMKEIAKETEEGVSNILDKLKLSEFKETFQENQINGELIVDIEEEEFVADLGLTLFQAKKLRFYVRGWRVFDSEATGANEPDDWSVQDVYTRMNSVNLKSFASFCLENQIDGKLLNELMDESVLKCLREAHDVKLGSFEEKKLKRFVKGGWRPDSSMKK